ncbi:glycosyltransferase family 2 protein [Raoultella planticola]|uniref:glycosyltransferase family 2 protein n=1 Tax=Raoultella planticola TaxID=575 RepID=UPI00114DB32C|nr:glycosyltransferase family 2 protein [Raoultella planticola]TQN55424.1 glycosyltransferase family 2 protein [Raoultella planticola]
MNFGVVIVLFNPSDANIKHLESLASSGITLAVVDNSPSFNNIEGDNILYIHNKNVGGIAGALNKGINTLLRKGYDFFYTFDQDSIFDSSYFDKMNLFKANEKAEIVCPDFYDINAKTHGMFIHLDRWGYHDVRGGKTASFAITSGMGISKNAWEVIGEFNEDYFIDHVDSEYCLRASNCGINIYVNYDVCIEHEIGKREKHKFLGVTLKPNNHNYIRKYYIVRNGTHCAIKMLRKSPSFFNLNLLRVIHEFLCVILYEQEKIKKLKFMFRGLRDATTGRLGDIKELYKI